MYHSCRISKAAQPDIGMLSHKIDCCQEVLHEYKELAQRNKEEDTYRQKSVSAMMLSRRGRSYRPGDSSVVAVNITLTDNRF